ncbi:MAG TPA: hypothetical protein VFE47_24930 [Tepidisphaeraceae bacterium]|jgi:hypothetical protein|nr:hypothetical protein [Tepidisphaeraceae bacterium]
MGFQVKKVRIAPVLAGVICTGLSYQSTFAQAAAPDTRPTSAPASGNWWDSPDPAPPGAMPDARNVNPNMGRRDASPYRDSITDYPTGQMNDWVYANAMAARARAMRERAQTELNQTIHRVQQRFEHSDDFMKATVAERQAYTAYVNARQQVLVQLGNDPKYHAIMQLHDELGEKIVSRRYAKADADSIDNWLAQRGFDRTKLSGPQMITLKAMFESEQQKAAASDDAPKDDILALATLKLQYASDARAIEVTAMNADDNLKAAREKMIDSSKRVTDLKAQFEYALHDNPEVLIARRNLEDARISVIESDALACSASLASNYALNYSYYLHRNDNGGVNGPYGGGNGTYAGYSTPYWGR